MTFSFHPEAEKEFLHSISYYEDCEPGLGIDFALEVQASIKKQAEQTSGKNTSHPTASSFRLSEAVIGRCSDVRKVGFYYGAPAFALRATAGMPSNYFPNPCSRSQSKAGTIS